MQRGAWRGKGWAGRGHKRKPNNARPNEKKDSSSPSKIPQGQPIATILNESSSDDDKVFRLYFPGKDTSSSTELIEKSKYAKIYYQLHRNLFDLEKIENTRSVHLDLQSLSSNEEFIGKWPNFIDELTNDPETTLRIFEYAFHEHFSCDFKIRMRLKNHQPITPLANLKVNYYGKLVTVRGTVMRVGTPTLTCTSMAFECGSCHALMAVTQPQGVYTAPTFCASCKSCLRLEAKHASPFTITTDWQTAKLQEIQSQSACGAIPRAIEVELLGDLSGSLSPGDVVSVTGVLQVRSESKSGDGDGNKSARLLQLYIEANSVNAHKNLAATAVSFTISDYYAIREIHSMPDVFRLLVHSLCPSIYGHEAVKAGVILGLMGGGSEDERCIHVLNVGDPGLGKSRLLQAAVQVAPRGVYVCGASTSAGGVSACATRSGDGGGIEAGALVLAHAGLCAVDELDNMPNHAHAALLEAMERGRVSVAKAGAVCSLAARASLLAAANPNRGHYDRSKTVVENLKINTALLSRFDLVFILMDNPDLNIDGMLSDHVLAMHAGKALKNNYQTDNDATQQLPSDDFIERLRLRRGEVIDALPPVLLRKYIAYAKRYVHPKLSDEAAKVLQEFYLSLRSKATDDGTPVTTRQLEACVRLTLARARASLRETATVDDAREVTSLLKASLAHTLTDIDGHLQLSRAPLGAGLSQKALIKKFLEVITLRANQVGKNTFSTEELKQLHTAMKIGGNVTELIDSLHTHSYLLHKGNGVYRVLSI